MPPKVSKKVAGIILRSRKTIMKDGFIVSVRFLCLLSILNIHQFYNLVVFYCLQELNRNINHKNLVYIDIL